MYKWIILINTIAFRPTWNVDLILVAALAVHRRHNCDYGRAAQREGVAVGAGRVHDAAEAQLLTDAHRVAIWKRRQLYFTRLNMAT
jgi:hypothetical protein